MSATSMSQRDCTGRHIWMMVGGRRGRPRQRGRDGGGPEPPARARERETEVQIPMPDIHPRSHGQAPLHSLSAGLREKTAPPRVSMQPRGNASGLPALHLPRVRRG